MGTFSPALAHKDTAQSLIVRGKVENMSDTRMQMEHDMVLDTTSLSSVLPPQAIAHHTASYVCGGHKSMVLHEV
jgi:hypothetical protein